jgi:opacity protein-like surface antigen
MKFIKILLLLVFAVTAANSYNGIDVAFNIMEILSKMAPGRTYYTDNATNATYVTQKNNVGLYISAASSFRGSNKYKSIVGSGRYDELIIGIYSEDIETKMNGARLYMSFYYNDKQSNERGYAYGFEVDTRLMENIPFYLTTGVEYGQGRQHIGDSERSNNDRPIEMMSDTKVSSLTGLLGLSYHITEHFAVDLIYTPSFVEHHVKYRYLDRSEQRTTKRHLGEFVNGVRFGASFRF